MGVYYIYDGYLESEQAFRHLYQLGLLEIRLGISLSYSITEKQTEAPTFAVLF